MTKKYVCCTPYQSKHTWYDCFFGVQVWNDDIPRCFFHFFEILICWGVRGGAERGGTAKNGPKWQKNFVSLYISGTIYLIWLWFSVHMFKMISPAFFFFSFFKILIFRVFQSSPINAKRKFWGVPHLLHMCIILSFNLTFKKVIHPRVSVSSNVTSLFGIKFENVFIIVSLKTEVFQGIPQKCTAVVVNIFKDVHYNSRTWQSFGGEKYEHLKANRAIQK